MADINLGNGGDTTDGTPDNDAITGGNGDDDIGGGAGNDVISGGNGEDIIEGGIGNDVMSGGRGIDTFVFNFTVSQGVTAQSYAEYAAERGITLEDGQITQNAFSTSYTAWLQSLIGELGLGADTDGDGIISFGLNQNASADSATPYIEGMTTAELDALFGEREDLTVNSGRTTQERYYSDLEGGAPIITAHDGTDTILDFRGRSMGEDDLQFNGIAEADQFNALFTVSQTDTDSDGAMDTVIEWDGGSITLLGVSLTSIELTDTIFG